jgi:predicted MFS family arabinose efflux permease
VYAALFVLYATRSLGVSPGALGLVLGAASVGALLAASVTKPLVRRIGIGRAYVLSQIAFPAPLLLVPLASGGTVTILALLFVAEFLSGAGVMVLDITAGSLMTAATPDALRARTAGAQRTINYGIRPVGALLGGFLGTTMGVHAALWIGAAGGVLGVLWLLGSPVPRMSEI